MSGRKKKKFSIKVVADLSGWEMDDWVSQLEENIAAEVVDGQVVITLGREGGAQEATTRKIGEEMLQSFFGEGFLTSFSAEGMRLIAEGEVPEVTIPWPFLMIDFDETEDDPYAHLQALAKWLHGELIDIDRLDRFAEIFQKLIVDNSPRTA